MKSKIVSMLVLLALTASLFGGVITAGAQTNPSIYMAPAFGAAGDTFSVDVMVNTAGETMVGWGFDLSWDPALVELTGWTKDPYFGTTFTGGDFSLPGTIDNGAGTLVGASVAGLGTGGATGTFRIATLNFVSIAGNGRSDQVFSNILLVKPGSIPMSPVDANGGFIQIGPAANVQVTAISFTPGTGGNFDAEIVVRNNGGSDSLELVDGLVVTATNVVDGGPFTFTVPALTAGQQTSFPLPLELSGTDAAVVTGEIAYFGSTLSNTFSAVSDEGDTIVNASFGAFLMIDPDDLIEFTLALGPNYEFGNLNVKCNTHYKVDVYDANPAAGHLAEFDGATFVAGGPSLIEPLTLVSSEQSLNMGAAPQNLVDGEVSGQNADLGEDWALTYGQVLKYADPLIQTAGNYYHTVVTYYGYVTAD